MIRALLLLAALLLLTLTAAAQELMYALPGGASADNISTHNAFAARRGMYYAAVSAHTEPDANEALDGLAVIGMGLGRDASAVELTMVTSDLDRLSGRFLSVKWHFRNETARAPALAVGIEDLTAAASPKVTAYLAATKTFWDTSAPSAFLMRKTVSAGFGGGRFRRRLFGAVSASLDPFSKAILEHDGRGVNAGISLSRPVSRRTVAVAVVGRQHLDRPAERAWTMSLAVAWEN